MGKALDHPNFEKSGELGTKKGFISQQGEHTGFGVILGI
jgi:hypothetical protein